MIDFLRTYLKAHPVRSATLQSVLFGFLWQFIILVSGIIAARSLGPEGRGYLALLAIFPAVLCHLGGLGLPQAVTFYISEEPRNAILIARAMFRIYAAQLVVLTGALFVLLKLIVMPKAGFLAPASLITLPTIAAMLAQNYGLALLQGLGRYRLFNYLRIVQFGSYTVLLVLLLLMRSLSLMTVVSSWVCSHLLSGSVIVLGNYLVLKSRDGAASGASAPSPSLRRMLNYGLKGILGELSPIEAFRLDQLFAGLLLSVPELGIYVVSKAFCNLPRFVAQSIGIVAFPEVARNRNGANPGRFILKFIGLVALINVILVVALILAMPVMVVVFFGKDFQPSIGIARLLLVGIFFLSLRSIMGEVLKGLGRPGFSTIIEIGMYLWLLFSLPLLTSGYGIQGLSWALVIGYSLSSVIAAMYLKMSFPSGDLASVRN